MLLWGSVSFLVLSSSWYLADEKGQLTCDCRAGIEGATVTGAKLQRYGAGGRGRPIQCYGAAGGDGAVAAWWDFEGIRAGRRALGGDEGAQSGGDEGN